MLIYFLHPLHPEGALYQSLCADTEKSDLGHKSLFFERCAPQKRLLE